MDERQHDPDASAERAASAVRSLDVPAPARLRNAVEAAVADAQRARRRPVRPLVVAAVVAVAAIALGLTLWLPADEPAVAGPTVPEASRVALAEPTGAAPAPRPGGRLSTSIDGIAFPDWSRSATHGWRAAGERTDELGGRTLKTVTYVDDRGQRIGYAIARGPALPWGDGAVTERNGVKLWVYDVRDATVVAWLRDGRTCILAGRDVDPLELMRLASSRNA